MAISNDQKLDYLWKKLGFGVTKTDTNEIKKAPNEAIKSPLLLRADKLLTDSSSIPGVIPTTSTSVVQVYPTTNPVEATADVTSTANRTWKTGVVDWIPPEFGSTYLVKVYIHSAGDATNASTGDQVFTTGSGNDDEWFFDYQSGVLHFIGENLPNGVDFTGKSVYISGARYTGTFGLSASATQGLSILEVNDTPNVNVGNVSQIKFNTNNGFNLTDEGAGVVLVEITDVPTSLTDLGIPDGQPGQILATDGNGNFTFQDDTSDSSIPATETFVVSGSSQSSFTLATTPGDEESIDVYVNAVIQVPGSAENYTLNNNILVLNDPVPSGGEVIVKHRSAHVTISNLNASSVKNSNLDLSYTSHEYSGDGITTGFTCQAGHTVHSVLVFVNGLVQSTSSYSVTGSTITFNTAPLNGQTIFFRYFPV